MMKTIQGYTYKVSQHIGKGYSSTVHKGINDKTGQEISIKVIEMIKLQDPINQMLLQYQVSALKNLTFSSNVLHLYDVYATKNNTYIITQLCEGDLGTLLKQKKQFPYYEAVEILKQLINGYNDIHKVGFLHRDIKPANIFYKKGVYKIGDFGFAIPANQIDKHKDYNVGSPVYMPPEALKNNLYSVSCDTWAIGVVPWRAISQQKLHEKLITEPLHTLTTGLPQIARNFLSQILNLDPQRRMKPIQMISWITKLTAVQIRSMSPYQPRRQNPLQEIKIGAHYNNTLKAHSQSNNHFNSNQNVHNNSVSNTSPLNIIKQAQNCLTVNTPIINKINYIKKNQENQQEFFQIKVLSEQKYSNQAQIFSHSYINYLKFVHRVLKFIGYPTKIPLDQLQQSTIRHLFKEFQRISKLKQIENCFQLNIQKWSEFVKSQKGDVFNKKLQKYQAKYKMFHLLTAQYPPQVYKEQIISGILKIFKFLQQKQDNFSQKAVIALDYLITFYQLIELKSKFSLKQFLKVSKIDQIMNGSPYNVKRQHLSQLKKKMELLNIICNQTKMIQRSNFEQNKNKNRQDYYFDLDIKSMNQRVKSEIQL